MKQFVVGVILGILLTSGGMWYVSKTNHKATPLVQQFQVGADSANAATNSNFASTLSQSSTFNLILGISDANASQATVNKTDLTSLEITFTKAEAQINRIEDTSVNQPGPQWELLNLTQPTVELFGIRGSNGIAQLGKTPLAKGTYQSLKLTIGAIKGRRSNGQTVDVTIDKNNNTIELKRFYSWSGSQQIEFVVDFDSLISLTQNGTNYLFNPTIKRLTQNGQTLN